MSNINWNQFFNNNFPNNFGNNQGGMNTNAAGNARFNPMPIPNPLPMQNQTPLDVLLPNYIAQLSQTKAELASLDQQQTVKMLKELLQMPKEFDNLLAQLTNQQLPQSQQQAAKTALVLLASHLNMSQLSTLLQNSSKEAMTNLYQMLAQYNQLGISIKDEQLGQISKLISFISASAASDVQSLKTTMLMYLPWLPLTDPDAFKCEINGSNGTNGGANDDNVTVHIATENYGNISIYIVKTEQDGIRIQVTSSQTFPQKDFVDLMREEGNKYGININFDLETKEVFNKEKQEKSTTQVYLSTSPGVNPFLLLISNSAIKNVHTIDSKENLKIQRKERMDNGKNQD